MIKPSIADSFVAVMAEIQAIEPGEDDPMRYVKWRLQDQAKRALSDAVEAAGQLAGTARMLDREYKDAMKEVLTRATPQNKE